MNPLTDEELIANCKKAITAIKEELEFHQPNTRFGSIETLQELLSRFRKLTQPEQVSGDLTERIVEAINNAATIPAIHGRNVIAMYVTELRTAIQTAINGKIDKR